jgi:hypothetical protein
VGVGGDIGGYVAYLIFWLVTCKVNFCYGVGFDFFNGVYPVVTASVAEGRGREEGRKKRYIYMYGDTQRGNAVLTLGGVYFMWLVVLEKKNEWNKFVSVVLLFRVFEMACRVLCRRTGWGGCLAMRAVFCLSVVGVLFGGGFGRVLSCYASFLGDGCRFCIGV